MKLSLKKGLSFGLTSGVITTLGMIVGIDASTNSQLAVIAGIAAIAVADSFSDAFGIHVSEESENKHSKKEIWDSTIATFVSKFLVASTFIIPVLLLELNLAVLVNVIWGMLLIVVFNFFMARDLKEKPYKIILEHLAIAVVVVTITYVVGNWIGNII
jgi:VIT1/CCC1 family predicted Fe2+/Mn2+ transporter